MRATDLSHRPVIQGLREATGHANTTPATADASPSEPVKTVEHLPAAVRLEEVSSDAIDELDDLGDDRLWDTEPDLEPDAESDLEPNAPELQDTLAPFTPPVPVLHDVDPLLDLDPDSPVRRHRGRLPRRWRWFAAGAALLLVVVIVQAGGDPPASIDTPASATPRAAPTAPMTARSRAPHRTPRSTGSQPTARRAQPKSLTETKPPVLAPPRPSAAPSPAPARTRPAPAPRSPWSDEFFRP